MSMSMMSPSRGGRLLGHRDTVQRRRGLIDCGVTGTMKRELSSVWLRRDCSAPTASNAGAFNTRRTRGEGSGAAADGARPYLPSPPSPMNCIMAANCVRPCPSSPALPLGMKDEGGRGERTSRVEARVGIRAGGRHCCCCCCFSGAAALFSPFVFDLLSHST